METNKLRRNCGQNYSDDNIDGNYECDKVKLGITIRNQKLRNHLLS